MPALFAIKEDEGIPQREIAGIEFADALISVSVGVAIRDSSLNDDIAKGI
jgi:hypothetical protein